MAPEPREASWIFWPSRAKIRYQPLGVVGVISPWNYPVYLALSPIISALAAGNRVLLKPSELTPRTSALLVTLLEAAVGGDVVRVVTGDAAVGAAFSRLPLDHLLFTGSTPVGHHIMAAASEHLTPVTLELGGKSPVLLHEGCSLRLAAERIMTGKLLNAGQTCIAPDYVLCPASRREAFVAALQRACARKLPKVKDNPEYTSIISERHRVRLLNYIEDARARGAQVLALAGAGEALEDSTRLAPVVLWDVRDEMAVMQEEIFGPILPVVTYERLEDALAYIRARPRPLALYYFDRLPWRAERVLSGVVAGGVTVNDTMVHIAQENLPFGGVGASGMGAYHGIEGFTVFSHRRGELHQSRLSVVPALVDPARPRLSRWVVRLLVSLLR